MNISKSIVALSLALTLTACQTTSPSISPSDLLLANIDTSVISQSASLSTLGTTNPTCATFYENASKLLSQPVVSDVISTKPSFGSVLLKTVVLGTLSGVSGGAVAGLGIGSALAETAAVATASQVTYGLGSSVYDSVGDKIADGADAATAAANLPTLSPLAEIEKAAAQIGCVAPDAASIAAYNAEVLAYEALK